MSCFGVGATFSFTVIFTAFKFKVFVLDKNVNQIKLSLPSYISI